jgi:hypothetical protein
LLKAGNGREVDSLEHWSSERFWERSFNLPGVVKLSSVSLASSIDQRPITDLALQGIEK